MKRTPIGLAAVTVASVLWAAGCGSKPKVVDEAAAAPPPAQIVEQGAADQIKVDKPERFVLVEAKAYEERPQLHATGTITPNVERSIPVVSLAAGRVVGIYAKLGDDVKKGQLLLKVQSNDINNGFLTLNQAKADEQLAKTQFERAKLLYDKGAISLNDLQVAQDTEEKARVAVTSAEQQLRVLGADPSDPKIIVNVYAPASGTIVEQNITMSASVHTPDNQPNLFTIADLSNVWVLCDVYENDLPVVRLGDQAEVQLNAYPDKTFRGRISNIGRVLDPNTRSAKVRIELSNPGIMRVGMFVTATFFGAHGKVYSEVPSSAILHLHDRDWIFTPSGNGQFRRLGVAGGKIQGNMQIVTAGLTPGQQVVKDALALSTESEQ